MNIRRSAKSGFTIVELLIVIVVIGILSVLVITNFSRTQTSARNADRVAGAKEWVRIFKSYVADKGALPPGLGGHACLGAGYLPTDMDANPDEDCYMTLNVKHPSNAINTALRPYSSTLPSYSVQPIAAGSANGSHIGISLRSQDTIDGIAGYPAIVFMLEGSNQDCVLRPIIEGSGNTSTTSTTGAKNSGNMGNNTFCRIGIISPESI